MSTLINIERVFELEVECWCYGLSHYKGDLDGTVVQKVLKELAPTFQAAMIHEFIFDLSKVSRQIAAASAFQVEEIDVALGILLQLPHPADLDEGAQYVMARILEQAEHTYGPVLQHLEARWLKQKRKLDRLKSKSSLPRKKGRKKGTVPNAIKLSRCILNSQE